MYYHEPRTQFGTLVSHAFEQTAWDICESTCETKNNRKHFDKTSKRPKSHVFIIIFNDLKAFASQLWTPKSAEHGSSRSHHDMSTNCRPSLSESPKAKPVGQAESPTGGNSSSTVSTRRCHGGSHLHPGRSKN